MCNRSSVQKGPVILWKIAIRIAKTADMERASLRKRKNRGEIDFDLRSPWPLLRVECLSNLGVRWNRRYDHRHTERESHDVPSFEAFHPVTRVWMMGSTIW